MWQPGVQSWGHCHFATSSQHIAVVPLRHCSGPVLYPGQSSLLWKERSHSSALSCHVQVRRWPGEVTVYHCTVIIIIVCNSFVLSYNYTWQERYGTLVAAFRVQGDTTVLLVPFENLPQTKMGCPLFVRGQDVVAVPSTSVICDVSFMHHCGNGCRVCSNSSTRQIERETVTNSGALFLCMTLPTYVLLQRILFK